MKDTSISTRMLCSILENMRKCYETRNFSYLPSLIEEAQYRAERMEDAIERINGWGGLESMEEQRIAQKREVRELRMEKQKLLAEVEELKANAE
jgi:hypothetical protein